MWYINVYHVFLLFQSKALGRVLFEQVCRQLHLLEADYFGLEYQDANSTRVSFVIVLVEGICGSSKKCWQLHLVEMDLFDLEYVVWTWSR